MMFVLIIFFISLFCFFIYALPTLLKDLVYLKVRSTIRNYTKLGNLWYAWLQDYESVQLSYFGRIAMIMDMFRMVYFHFPKICEMMEQEEETKNVDTSSNYVFLLSMPRSGSTSMHHIGEKNLVHAKTLPFWRQQYPFTDKHSFAFTILRLLMKIASWRSPDLAQKHLVEFDKTDEEILLMSRLCGYPDNRFLWMIGSFAYFNAVTSEDIVDDDVILLAYKCLKTYCDSLPLKEKEFWLMKSPVHLYPRNLQVLLQVFPNANFIYLKREGTSDEQMVGSYASMSYSAQKIFLKREALKKSDIGPNVMRHLCQCAKGAAYISKILQKEKNE